MVMFEGFSDSAKMAAQKNPAAPPPIIAICFSKIQFVAAIT